MNSTTVPGDVDKELSDAAKLRELSDDEDSDAETDMFSFVEHPKAVEHDPGSKRQRKHFFKFIEGVMSSIRHWEGNQLHLSESQPVKNVKKGNKNDLFSTLNFNTSTQGQACN